MITTIFENSHALTIAAFIFGAFAGLYGYNGIIGHRGGILRQLLVGLTSGVVFGSCGYIFDTVSHSLFSDLLRDLLPIPGLPMTSVTVALLFAVPTFLQTLVSPNSFRLSFNRERSHHPWLTFALNLTLGALHATILQVLAAQVIFMRWDIFHGIHPSLFAVIAVCYASSLILYFTMLVAAGAKIRASPTRALTEDYGCIYSLLYLPLYTVPGWVTLIYIISVVGWGVFLYLGISAIAITLLAAAQYGADHFDQDKLQYVSLVLFLLATALGLYNLIKFGSL